MMDVNIIVRALLVEIGYVLFHKIKECSSNSSTKRFSPPHVSG